jgi:2-methylfumaryl-CoA isomerase
VWDGMTGFLAAFAILAAERHRRLHSEGQLVELSLSDVGLAVAGHLGLIGEAMLEAQPRGRFGNDVYGTFGRDFGTRDGLRVMVLALTARQWASLGEATALARDFAALEARVGADFQKEADRWVHRGLLCEMLAAWVTERNLAEVGEAFERHGVLWGPYKTFKQLVAEDARASTANPMFAEIEHPGLGSFLTAGSPLRFSAAGSVPPRPAPALGEHTEEVLREFGL